MTLLWCGLLHSWSCSDVDDAEDVDHDVDDNENGTAGMLPQPPLRFVQADDH